MGHPKMVVGVLTAALLIAALEPVARASCAGPEVQIEPSVGGTINASCKTIIAALPGDLYPGGAKTFELEWGNTQRLQLPATTPTTYNAPQSEALIDPQTCKERWESWDVPFLIYTLTVDQPLPADTKIILRIDGVELSNFTLSAANAYCPSSLMPTMGMCGSGWPAPVPGCEDAPLIPGGELPPDAVGDDDVGEGGCSVGGAAGLPSGLALLLLLALLRRRG